MSFGDLPHVVLSLVLGASLSERKGLSQFKDNLPLAAVCRRWRCLALQIICSDVYVSYNDEDLGLESSSNGSSSSEGSSPNDSSAYNSSDYIAIAKTNMDLIASAGCVGFVRHVHVSASFTSGYINAFEATAEMMRDAASTWPGVNTFNVSAYLRESWSSRRAIANDCKEIMHVSRALASLMPRVRRLALDSNTNVEIVGSGYVELARYYAGQLEHLHCNHPDFLPPDCQFKQLMEADVDCSYKASPLLLSVDPTKLAKLVLTNVPPSLAWAGFDADSGPQIIKLPALRSLWLSYPRYPFQEPVPQHEQSWKLHLPQLQTLDITCESEVCPVLKSAVFPACIAKLSISVRASLLQPIADMALPAARNLVLTIIYSPGDNQHTAVHINRILSDAYQGEEMQLLIHDRSIQIPHRAIPFTYTGLTRLAIGSEIEAHMLFDLLRKLPRLTVLDVDKCVLRGGRHHFSISALGKTKLIEPLNMSIRQLTLWFTATTSTELATLVIKYLVLRLPSLTSLAVPEKYGERIMSIVRKYSKQHPHLLDINLLFEC